MRPRTSIRTSRSSGCSRAAWTSASATERAAWRPGDVAVIPGGVEHEGFFPEDTEVIDVFAPPREDFLAGGTPAYMRKSE